MSISCEAAPICRVSCIISPSLKSGALTNVIHSLLCMASENLSLALNRLVKAKKELWKFFFIDSGTHDDSAEHILSFFLLRAMPSTSHIHTRQTHHFYDARMRKTLSRYNWQCCRCFQFNFLRAGFHVDFPPDGKAFHGWLIYGHDGVLTSTRVQANYERNSLFHLILEAGRACVIYRSQGPFTENKKVFNKIRWARPLTGVKNPRFRAPAAPRSNTSLSIRRFQSFFLLALCWPSDIF